MMLWCADYRDILLGEENGNEMDEIKPIVD
jgi:hypothetical protein